MKTRREEVQSGMLGLCSISPRGIRKKFRDLINRAIFYKGHDELVIVKDIDVFSLCEHHMVPFTGQVWASDYNPYRSH